MNLDEITKRLSRLLLAEVVPRLSPTSTALSFVAVVSSVRRVDIAEVSTLIQLTDDELLAWWNK